MQYSIAFLIIIQMSGTFCHTAFTSSSHWERGGVQTPEMSPVASQGILVIKQVNKIQPRMPIAIKEKSLTL